MRTRKEILQEFEKRFIVRSVFGSCIFDINGVEEIIAFLNQALTEAQEAVKIEKLPLREKEDMLENTWRHNTGFNQACDKQQELLKQFNL